MKDRKNLIIIAVIMAIAATSMFLVVEITAVFLIAYAFALIGIAGLFITAVKMTEQEGTYPWGAAIPLQAVTYSVVELLLSVVIVTLKELNVYNLPPAWFAVIHILILAFFAVRLVMLNGGKRHIEETEERLNAKNSMMKTLQTEAALLAEAPCSEAVQERVKKFSEAVRYSDPITNESLVDTEAELVAKTKALQGKLQDEEAAIAQIEELEQLLKLRNIKAKMTK